MEEIVIKKFDLKSDAEVCAKIMADSDPWKRLNFSYELCLKSFEEPLAEFYVILEKDLTIGFISIQMEGAFTGYIKRICIHKDWRRKGIGSKLMKFAEDRIFKEKHNAFLCVSSFNTEAKKLYLKLGYEEVGELKDYVAPGFSEIIMRKSKGPMLNIILTDGNKN